MNEILSTYNQFLTNFPPALQPFISIVLAVLIIYAIIRIIQKDFIYIILLVVLLPASVPILKNIGDSLINIVKFLLGK